MTLIHRSIASDASEPAGSSKTMGSWLDAQRPIGQGPRLSLGILGWTLFLLGWAGVVYGGLIDPKLLAGPDQVLLALWELIAQKAFLEDVWASLVRILLSFAIACAVAVPLGLLMGAYPAMDALVGPLVGPARYLPAPSFIPLLLMWFGAGDAQKIALLWLGVIWFLLTLIADATKLVSKDMLETARTLGCARGRLLFKVILPAAAPGIVTAMRQMMAVGWTYLTIAEIVATTDGIGAVIQRARRFGLVNTDEVLACILTIGLLGIALDLLFRLFHRWAFPYLYVGR